jgi:catalase (peroxidase I)
MYQILTGKLNNIYENDEEENEKVAEKIELIDDSEDVELIKRKSILNIEFKVANDPTFRPKIYKKYETNNEQFIELMKRCWSHYSENRPVFIFFNLFFF